MERTAVVALLLLAGCGGSSGPGGSSSGAAPDPGQDVTSFQLDGTRYTLPYAYFSVLAHDPMTVYSVNLSEAPCGTFGVTLRFAAYPFAARGATQALDGTDAAFFGPGVMDTKITLSATYAQDVPQLPTDDQAAMNAAQSLPSFAGTLAAQLGSPATAVAATFNASHCLSEDSYPTPL
jgi:hypothetical protein